MTQPIGSQVGEKRILIGVTTTGEQPHDLLAEGWQILQGCNGPFGKGEERICCVCSKPKQLTVWWLWMHDEQAARDAYDERKLEEALLKEQEKTFWDAIL